MATFNATGTSASQLVQAKHALAITFSGGAAAEVLLERATDLTGVAWVPLRFVTRSSTEEVPPGLYRLRCSRYTSGTVTYTLAQSALNLVEFKDNTGTVKFSVDADGNVVGGGSGGGGGGSTSPIAIAYAATVTLDTTTVPNGSIFVVGALTGNITFASPTGLVAGTVWTARGYIRQDATGSRTASWGANFKWPGGIAGVLSTAANALDVLDLSWDGTSLIAALSKGFA